MDWTRGRNSLTGLADRIGGKDQPWHGRGREFLKLNAPSPLSSPSVQYGATIDSHCGIRRIVELKKSKENISNYLCQPLSEATAGQYLISIIIVIVITIIYLVQTDRRIGRQRVKHTLTHGQTGTQVNIDISAQSHTALRLECCRVISPKLSPLTERQ